MKALKISLLFLFIAGVITAIFFLIPVQCNAYAAYFELPSDAGIFSSSSEIRESVNANPNFGIKGSYHELKGYLGSVKAGDLLFFEFEYKGSSTFDAYFQAVPFDIVNGRHNTLKEVYKYDELILNGDKYTVTPGINCISFMTDISCTGGIYITTTYSYDNVKIFTCTPNRFVNYSSWVFSNGYGDGASDGQNQGYDIGFADGKSEGLTEGFFNGREEGYNAGLTVGSNQGYESGYTEGHNTGYTEGYNSGVVSGTAAGDEAGYNRGFAEGKNEGKIEGYNQGSTDGYATGFNVGKNEGIAEGMTAGKEEGLIEGYDNGYDVGYNQRYDELYDHIGQDKYDAGVSSGFSSGYTEGLSSASSIDETGLGAVGGTIAATTNVFVKAFDTIGQQNVFGIPLWSLISLLIAISLITLIYRLIKRG